MNIKQNEESQGQVHAARAGQGLSNLAYNLVTILQNKAKGVRAYDTYIMDAQEDDSQECVDLLKRIQRDDLKHIEALKKQITKALGATATDDDMEILSEKSPSDLQTSSGRSADIGRTAASASPSVHH